MSRVGDLSGPSHMHLASHVCLCMLSMSLIVVSANVDALDSYVHVQPIRPELGSLAHSPSNVASPPHGHACIRASKEPVSFRMFGPTQPRPPPLRLRYPGPRTNRLILSPGPPPRFAMYVVVFSFCGYPLVHTQSLRPAIVYPCNPAMLVMVHATPHLPYLPNRNVRPQQTIPHKILLLHPSP